MIKPDILFPAWLIRMVDPSLTVKRARQLLWLIFTILTLMYSMILSNLGHLLDLGAVITASLSALGIMLPWEGQYEVNIEDAMIEKLK